MPEGMAVRAERASPLPEHVKDAVAQISAMQASHHGEATLMERFTDSIISVIGTSTFLFCVGGFTIAWVGIRFSLSGWIDPPPFPT